MSSNAAVTLLVEVNASGLYSPNAAPANRVAAGRLERFSPFAIISQKIFDLPTLGPNNPSGSASVRGLACRRCATPLFGGTPRFLIALARENFHLPDLSCSTELSAGVRPASVGCAVQSFAVDTHARGNDQSADRSFWSTSKLSATIGRNMQMIVTVNF
jgi:hypothetical protein